MTDQCTECRRDATHIVNNIAPVCDHHAEGARLEGWLVVPMGEEAEEARYYKDFEKFSTTH